MKSKYFKLNQEISEEKLKELGLTAKNIESMLDKRNCLRGVIEPVKWFNGHTYEIKDSFICDRTWFCLSLDLIAGYEDQQPAEKLRIKKVKDNVYTLNKGNNVIAWAWSESDLLKFVNANKSEIRKNTISYLRYLRKNKFNATKKQLVNYLRGNETKWFRMPSANELLNVRG